MTRPDRRIALISDGTCDTAENVVKALLALFNKPNAPIQRFPRIRTESELTRTLDALPAPHLIAYTFATEKIRKLIWTELRKRKLIGMDVLYPGVQIFSDFFETSPIEKEGSLHSTEAIHYVDRIEAIEFTVKHDDGMRLDDIHGAQIVLTGVSRTSKTPTSMYLGYKGYRVANVPLVPGVEVPEELVHAHEAKVPVIMLSIDSSHLVKIRQSRLVRLSSQKSSTDTYLDLQRINEELDAAQKLARRFGWPIINVTSKAIEETASEILLMIQGKLR